MKLKLFDRSLLRLSLSACLLAGASAGAAATLAAPAQAAEQARRFDIPAQALSSALLAYSRQSDVMVVVSPDMVDGKRSREVRGVLAPGAALDMLLSGSGLKALAGANGGVVLSRDDSGPFAQAAPEAPVKLEEVVVTAQKRRERLIDTPQSVSVLSSDALAKLGATQFRDFADRVPGLTLATSGAGQTQITLRGVTALTDNPTTGVIIDDVPIGSSSSFARAAGLALDVGLFDIDRIEVLRGPQGTLYGASTMGGLVKYVTRDPSLAGFGGQASAGVSATAHGGVSYTASGVVNAPLAEDKAGARISGFYSRDGGYIDNLTLGERDVNRADIYGGRLEVFLRPTDALTIRLGGFLQDISRDGSAVADYNLNGQPVDGALDQRRMFREPFDSRFRLASAVWSYDFGPAALTSITAYQFNRSSYFGDFTPVLIPVLQSIGFPYSALGAAQEQQTRKFTQEIRLASTGSRPLEWLVGGFYTHEDTQNHQAFEVLDLAGLPAPNILYDFSGPSTYEEIAGFGDLTYHLTTKLDVTGGVRYAHNNQAYTQNGSGLLIGSFPTARSDEGVATWLGDIRYRFSDHATAYLRYATGYRPGGPNFVANDPVTGQPLAPLTFEADRLTSYEAGFKAETPDRAFSADMAVYAIDWSNIQVGATRNGFGVVANAGDASVRGAELTLTARPTPGLSFSAAGAYQDAHLTQDAPDLDALKGDRLPGVPRFSASLNADYELAEMAWRPSVGFSLRYVSDRETSFDSSTSTPQYTLPSYTAVDLRAGVQVGEVWAQAYVHNLFDTRGQLTASGAAVPFAGPIPVSILQPRTAGISLTTRF